MKIRIIILVYLISSFCILTNARTISLIPYPTTLKQSEGECVLTSKTKLVIDKKIGETSAFYKELVELYLGAADTHVKKASSTILLKIDENLDCSEEGYKLNITSNTIELTASHNRGIFYGLQTLGQLANKDDKGKVSLPIVSIEDHPRFNWRGCMLDVSRTFMPKSLLLKYIDLFSYYKLNVLHLHLTDDQGWRIEIKKYPKLTLIGSKFDDDFNEMGGYYTQDDMKDIVKYASLRNITIVPEIEIPGHESAAIASYPELSCRNLRPQIHPFLMGKNIHEEIFCAGKPEVYEFLYNVLDEIMEIFPSEYIHIGGDEAPKKEWKNCKYCQQTIKANHLANEEELQSYFVKKIDSYLRTKGRTLVGWDEIVEGGKLSGNEVVMFWRSWEIQKIKDSALNGFKIISCPTSNCYFDYSYNSINTKKVYQWDPIPTNFDFETASKYIGIQANFWSHIDRCERGIDKQLFPRIFALSEVAWSQSKNWERFRNAAKHHCDILRQYNVKCFYDKCLYNVER